MRYLKVTKSGIWHFRFQIPPRHRHLFSGLSELKKSFGLCEKEQAIIDSLKLELKIRHAIKTNTSYSDRVKPVPLNPQNPQSPRDGTKVNHPLSPFTCLNRYIDSKRGIISDKAVELAHAKISIILSLLNKKEISDIRRLEAEEVRKLLLHYPVNAKKKSHFKGKSCLQIIEDNKLLKLPTLSIESVRDYIQKASSFFEWCVQMELTDLNPFKGMKFKKTRSDREAKKAYTTEDLTKIFSTEVYTLKQYKYSYYYWLPILGCLTGARLNELCQLYKADVYKIKNTWVIQIDDRYEGQKLKNTSSRRIVPIHDTLIELGFINYIQSLQGERIFPDLKNTRDGFSSAASKWFARVKKKLGFGRGHDFHSLRHTVATEFKKQGVSSVVAGEILGHAHNNITYDRYGKQIDTEQLAKAISLLSIPFQEVKEKT